MSYFTDDDDKNWQDNYEMPEPPVDPNVRAIENLMDVALGPVFDGIDVLIEDHKLTRDEATEILREGFGDKIATIFAEEH